MRIPKMMRAAILERFASPTLQCFLNYLRSSPEELSRLFKAPEYLNVSAVHHLIPTAQIRAGRSGQRVNGNLGVMGRKQL